MSKQLPCSVEVESTLTVAGIERKAVLRCGPDQHHIYCPAYYQNLIDDAEVALAEYGRERDRDELQITDLAFELVQRDAKIDDLERKLAEYEGKK